MGGSQWQGGRGAGGGGRGAYEGWSPCEDCSSDPREVERHCRAEQGRAALMVVEEEFLPWAEDRMRGRQGHFQAWGKDERVRVDQIPNVIWS